MLFEKNQMSSLSHVINYSYFIFRLLSFLKEKNYILLLSFKKKPYVRFFKKSKVKVRFFKSLVLKKKFYIFSKKKINYKVINLQTSQKSVLFFKRRYGVLKHLFKQKKYNLYKANFFINLRRKKKTFNSKSMTLLRFKKMKKIFFKINRKHILPKFDKMRQNKKNVRIYANFHKANENSFNLAISSFFVKSRIFLSKKDFTDYIRVNGFLHNGNFYTSNDIFLNDGDIVQLNFSPILLSPLVKRHKHFKKYLSKVKPRIFKMMRNKFDINKQSTTHIPRWVLKFTLFKEMKSTGIEFEFSSMTFIVLKKNLNFFSLATNFNINLTFYLNRLYNWKYIT